MTTTSNTNRVAIGATIIALLILVPAAAASAQSYGDTDGSLSVVPSTVTVGGEFTVTGGGFMPGSTVEVIFNNSTPTLLGTLPVSSTGVATGTFRVPADATPGEHRVDMVGIDPEGERRVLSQTVMVEAAAAAAPAAPASPAGPSAASPAPAASEAPASLAFTGGTILGAVALSALLVAAGVVALQFRRRRVGAVS